MLLPEQLKSKNAIRCEYKLSTFAALKLLSFVCIFFVITQMSEIRGNLQSSFVNIHVGVNVLVCTAPHPWTTDISSQELLSEHNLKTTSTHKLTNKQHSGTCMYMYIKHNTERHLKHYQINVNSLCQAEKDTNTKSQKSYIKAIIFTFLKWSGKLVSQVSRCRLKTLLSKRCSFDTIEGLHYCVTVESLRSLHSVHLVLSVSISTEVLGMDVPEENSCRQVILLRRFREGVKRVFNSRRCQ